MMRHSGLRDRLLAAIALFVAGMGATHAQAADVVTAAARSACSDLGAVTPKSVKITHSTRGGDLPYFQARDDASGASIRVYHDASLKRLAGRKVRCLSSLLSVLRAYIPDRSRHIVWSPMVITRDPEYRWERSKQEPRWVLRLPDGVWRGDADAFLFVTIPHEQVHVRQMALSAARMPRWFLEGHAEWAGLHATALVRPSLADAKRRNVLAAKEKRGAMNLKAWGSIRVKREAILRQLSPADRARAEQDPQFTPEGPFEFRPGDYEAPIPEDAYYGGSLAVFEALERRHGTQSVERWVAAVLASGDGKRIGPLAKSILGEDLDPLLRL
jgi:hypothetical protein